LVYESLVLCGRSFKPLVSKRKQQQFDPFVAKWLSEQKISLDTHNLYFQTDPDNHAVWKDFVKYSKPDLCPDLGCIRGSFEFLCEHFYPHCAGAGIWSHDQAISTWEGGSSTGYPWNLSIHLTRDFIPVFGSTMSDLYEEFLLGADPCVIWNVSPKYEIRSAEKINARKIRTFTAAPKHFSYMLQRLGGDFNERFFACNGRTWSRVGMSMFYGGWDEFIRYMLRFEDHLELDGVQFDSSLPESMFALCRRFRQMCYASSLDGKYDEPLARAYVSVVHGLCALPGGWLFLTKQGNKSGGVYTTIDNTKINFMAFAYAVLRAFQDLGEKCDYHRFITNCVAGLYGDDNNIGMSKEFAKILTPEKIRQYTSELGIEMRSEHPGFLPVTQLKFLNMRTIQVHGRYYPVPDTDKMRGSLLHVTSTHTYRFIRLCGLRLVCWWNADLMKEIEALIDLTRPHLLTNVDFLDSQSGMKNSAALAMYLTPLQMGHLWNGEEVASVNTSLF